RPQPVGSGFEWTVGRRRLARRFLFQNKHRVYVRRDRHMLWLEFVGRGRGEARNAAQGRRFMRRRIAGYNFGKDLFALSMSLRRSSQMVSGISRKTLTISGSN